MAESERLICSSEELEDGGPGFRFIVQRHGLSAPAFAIRFQSRVYAYLNQCGHVPAELDWQPGAFFDDSGLYLICSIHGALYDPQSGRCLSGRCRDTGLVPLSVEERDGSVYLHTQQ